ncbi:MAG: hypothetical protein M3Y60_04865 [Bacteroidota bacterium]|nr:hypothetical protein [Bacteroidota bacterium]
MKKLVYFILVVPVSCENRPRANEELPMPESEFNSWICFEGRVPLNDSSICTSRSPS